MKKYFFILVSFTVTISVIHAQTAIDQYRNKKAQYTVYSIEKTSDGGSILAGESIIYDEHRSSDFWVVKQDANKKTEWEKSLGGSDIDVAYSAKQTKDGGYIILGETSSNDGDVVGYHGNTDLWVVKLDSKGNTIWTKCIGGSDKEEAYTVQLINKKGKYIEELEYLISGTTFSSDGDTDIGNLTYNRRNNYWEIELSSSGKFDLPQH